MIFFSHKKEALKYPLKKPKKGISGRGKQKDKITYMACEINDHPVQ